MIEKLTEEQEQLLAVYRDKWVQKFKEMKPIDESKAKDVLSEVFSAVLCRSLPDKMYIEKSPLAAWRRVCELSGLDKESPFVWPYLDGVWSSGYYAWVDYYSEVLDRKFTPATYSYMKMADFDVVYPLDDAVVLSEPLLEVHTISGKGLHRDGGPAVRYADDFCVWALNGVRVPQWLAEDKRLEPKRFAEISNVEVRREFVRKIGIELLIEELHTEVLDKDGDYELHNVDLGGDVGVWPYLKMLNPSEGVWHLECVDRSCKSVAKALAWRNQSKLKPETLT